jgi:hypothetical protein
MLHQQTSGRVIFLRVHDVGTGWGPAQDHLDVEAVIRLDSQPGKAFGFQLRDDGNLATRQDALDLLRNAFNRDQIVMIDYSIEAGKNNGIINWVSLSSIPEARVEETPASLIAAEDPIVKGVRLDPVALLAELPNPPAGEQEVPGLMDKTAWLPVAEHTLAAGESHEITVSVAGPALLLARATWFDSSTPIAMQATLDGVLVSTGEPTFVPPNRGTVLLRAEITQAGNATVMVTNVSDNPVSVQVVVGSLLLSMP